MILAQVLVAKTESVHHAGPEVLDDDIGVRGEKPHDVASGRGAGVHRDRALAPVARLVQRAQPVDRYPDPAPDVPETGALDLHDVGALISEERDRVRAGQRDRQVEDADAREGTGPPTIGVSEPGPPSGHGTNDAFERGRPPGPLYARPYPGAEDQATGGSDSSAAAQP